MSTDRQWLSGRIAALETKLRQYREDFESGALSLQQRTYLETAIRVLEREHPAVEQALRLLSPDWPGDKPREEGGQ